MLKRHNRAVSREYSGSIEIEKKKQTTQLINIKAFWYYIADITQRYLPKGFNSYIRERSFFERYQEFLIIYQMTYYPRYTTRMLCEEYRYGLLILKNIKILTIKQYHIIAHTPDLSLARKVELLSKPFPLAIMFRSYVFLNDLSRKLFS